jgi:hypothetical protein
MQKKYASLGGVAGKLQGDEDAIGRAKVRSSERGDVRKLSGAVLRRNETERHRAAPS